VGQVGLIFFEGEEFVRAALASDGNVEEVAEFTMASARIVGFSLSLGPFFSCPWVQTLGVAKVVDIARCNERCVSNRHRFDQTIPFL
jgi:hypothetical protein